MTPEKYLLDRANPDWEAEADEQRVLNFFEDVADLLAKTLGENSQGCQSYSLENIGIQQTPLLFVPME